MNEKINDSSKPQWVNDIITPPREPSILGTNVESLSSQEVYTIIWDHICKHNPDASVMERNLIRQFDHSNRPQIVELKLQGIQAVGKSATAVGLIVALIKRFRDTFKNNPDKTPLILFHDVLDSFEVARVAGAINSEYGYISPQEYFAANDIHRTLRELAFTQTNQRLLLLTEEIGVTESFDKKKAVFGTTRGSIQDLKDDVSLGKTRFVLGINMPEDQRRKNVVTRERIKNATQEEIKEIELAEGILDENPIQLTQERYQLYSEGSSQRHLADVASVFAELARQGLVKRRFSDIFPKGFDYAEKNTLLDIMLAPQTSGVVETIINRILARNFLILASSIKDPKQPNFHYASLKNPPLPPNLIRPEPSGQLKRVSVLEKLRYLAYEGNETVREYFREWNLSW